MKGMPAPVTSDSVMEIIDHRAGNPQQEFPHAKIQNELVGAAATLIVERFIENKILPSSNNAKLLYGAIFHNTLNFISPNTTDRDKVAAKFLADNFNLSEELARKMFDFATLDIMNGIENAIISDAKQFGEFNFYQLVVSNLDYTNIEQAIAKTIAEQDAQNPCEWSILNIVDIATMSSSLFVPYKQGQDICSMAFNCHFKNSWAIIPATLRKQLIPKIL